MRRRKRLSHRQKREFERIVVYLRVYDKFAAMTEKTLYERPEAVEIVLTTEAGILNPSNLENYDDDGTITDW